MTWQAWMTLAVVLATLAALASERADPPIVVVTAVTVLLVSGVIDSKSALSGLANEAPVTIAALFVVAGAAEATGALESVARLVARPRPVTRDHPAGRDLARMFTPTAAISAFIYNTPLVSMIAPRLAVGAGRRGQPRSWYLMPMNIAVLLGGMVTAIGTTTNVVISGLLTGSHRKPLDLFEVTPSSLPVCAIGLLVLFVLVPRLMPRRHVATEDFAQEARSFTVEMGLAQGSLMVGATVAEAGLRNLEGVYLVEIRRDGVSIAPVAPTERLAEGDFLIFAGSVTRIADLQRMPGLVSSETPHFAVGTGRSVGGFYEAVVAPGSALAGSTLKDSDFRSRHQAAVVAIHRAGARVAGKLGSTVLHPGDVLLLLAGHDFRRSRYGSDFALMAPLDSVPPPVSRRQARIVEVVVAGFLVAVATGRVGVLNAALVAALSLLLLGVVTPSQARNSIDLKLLVVLCGSFGIGEAVGQSGLAAEIARLLIDAFQRFGDVGILAGVLVSTVLITQLVTNNATAVLMFPIALATAAQAHLHERPFILALVIGASASFLTPIGYQTNMIVHAMGGYRWSDFVRIGLPVLVAVVAVALVAIPLASPLR